MKDLKITSVFRVLILILVYCNIIVFTSLAQTYFSPESAVLDPAHGRYIISNAGDGISNGYLSAVDRHTLALSNFVTSGIDSPKGLCIVADTLYATNVTNVKAINLNSGSVIKTISVSGAQFLNDIATDNTYLYLSDNSNNKIFKVEIATGQLKATYSDPSLQGPNGLYVDAANNRLIICSYITNAPIQSLDLTSGNITLILGTSLANLDGITRDNAGYYYVSSWLTNKIYKFNNNLSVIIDSLDSGFSGPADIYYCTMNDTLVVPNWNSNSVDFIYIPSTSIYELESQDYYLKVFPNPVDNMLTIVYELDDVARVRIEVLDMNGKKICELFNKIQTPSYYKQVFDVKALSLHSGVYYVNCYFNEKKVLKKIIIPR